MAFLVARPSPVITTWEENGGGGGQKSYKKGNNELEKERVEMVYVKKRFSKNDLKLTI